MFRNSLQRIAVDYPSSSEEDFVECAITGKFNAFLKS